MEKFVVGVFLIWIIVWLAFVGLIIWAVLNIVPAIVHFLTK